MAAYRAAVTRDRGRLWIAMARESAHQLGTPLMSASAWVDRLEEGTTDGPEVAQHLRADLERLQRVVQRFERIGRPARRDRVALGALAERVATYFRPRLPKHANAVELCVQKLECLLFLGLTGLEPFYGIFELEATRFHSPRFLAKRGHIVICVTSKIGEVLVLQKSGLTQFTLTL